MSEDELYRRIERRYGFCIPDDYRAMRQRGWFSLKGPAAAADFTRPGDDYLWVHEMEWYSLPEILDYKFAEWEREEFVPFAITGAGDNWCWWPKSPSWRAAPVVLCPHDSCVGTIYAPNLLTAMYRQMLAFAGTLLNPEDAEEARAMLGRWCVDVAPLFPRSWGASLQQVRAEPVKTWKIYRLELHGLLTPEEIGTIEQREICFPEMDAEFEWHKPDA